MAEFDHPRPNRPEDSAAEDEVYGLADDDSSDSDDELSGSSPDPLDGPEDLAEGSRPGRPKGSSAPPPAPLPRIWKAAPDPREVRASKQKDPRATPSAKTPAPAARDGARSSGGQSRPRNEIAREGQVTKQSEKRTAAQPGARDRKSDRESPATGSKALVEETPAFDTYEARQRMRAMVGLVLCVGIVIGGIVLIRPYMPTFSSGEPDVPEIPTVDASTPQQTPESLEAEASGLFERARETAKKGDGKLAVSLLERVVASYPSTNVAREAKEALGRPARNLPLFIDRPVVVANALPPPAVVPPVINEVNAVTATAPQGTSSEVGLVYPANPAEPSRGSAGNPVQDEAPPVGRPLPKGFRSKPGTRAHESGWALEILGDRDGATMVLVPGGEFEMGNDKGESSERPAHRVKLSTYYIDQHEVSVRQFDLFEKEIGRRMDRVRALAREGTVAPTSADSPVVMVSAKEAKDFATWAGKRLPTEAQWEMAARGPGGALYPWGNEPADWGTKREPRQIDPIMTYPLDVSPYGACDMAGNAWEWTKDWYDPRFFLLAKNQVSSDPTGPSIVPRSLQLVVKGGSKTWTATRREGMKFEQRLPFLGFRCVLQVEGPGNAFEPPPKPATPGSQGTAPGLIDTGPPPPF